MKKLFTLLVIVFCFSVNAQTISTFAGNGVSGYSGDGGQANVAELNYPSGITFDAAGNFYFADQSSQTVRMINTAGIITTIAGTGTIGFTGDGGQATNAALHNPDDIAIDANGNLYLADEGNFRVRKINTLGIITTIAGGGSNSTSSMNGGQATDAFFFPCALAFDATGNLFIADLDNSLIRKVTTSGILTTIAGGGNCGSSYCGDGGQATNAELFSPDRILFDAVGNLYFTDANTSTLRKINTLGIISTVAGNGVSGFSGDGGQATAAELNVTTGVCIDAVGNIFISDAVNNRIRMVSTSGIIRTVVGNGTGAYSGDGGQAMSAEINGPEDITFDTSGNFYIADASNRRIRQVTNIAQSGISTFNTQHSTFQIYPNPTQNNFTVEVSNADKQTISVFDVNGNLVLSQTINGTTNIDAGNLSAGVYNISISNSAGVTNKRLVIVR